MSTQTVVEVPVRSETQEGCVAVQEVPYSVPQQSLVSTCQFYAGFWRRLVAYLIDYSVIMVVMSVIIIITVVSTGLLTGVMNETIGGQIGGTIGRIVGFFGIWLYFSLFESSRKQATLGKLALGIKIVGPDNTRISFGRATDVMAGFTDKKQALHDMVASCYVVRREIPVSSLVQKGAEGHNYESESSAMGWRN
jgi:uncharacterized RDD family membrane protein YckC